MTGQELYQLIYDKWGRSYDLQIRRMKGKIFVLVMWKYLEQASFPLSPDEYFAHFETIASYINAWGVVEQVRAFIDKTRENPRLGKAVSIPLDLGDRAAEWLLDEF